MEPFAAFETKMTAAGMGDAAIRAFRRNYEALLREETGLIPEETITSAERLPTLELIANEAPADAAMLAQAVVIKLNGGLGTGMGLQGPKSLLAVRDGVNFLDLMVRQILDLRKSSGAPVRLLLMNSFSTSAETLAHLEKYRADGLADAQQVELMQNQIPKIDAGTMAPAQWPADPALEWCPPGHGDLYPALVGSGWLDRLLAEGVKYAFVSNSDNLGAILDPAILGYFAKTGAPFLMEVTRRTAADKKGGHLALRPRDGRLILRESAQCPDADAGAFQDIGRHRFFNTNNLWIRLDHLKETLTKHGGLIPLPMIRNSKTADPRDKNSPAVYQLETAMGAAIESFPGAAAIEVSRARFAPVKTTSDLLIIRSDACRLTPDFRLELHPERHGVPPEVNLDNAHYKLVDGLDILLAEAIPSLRRCQKLSVNGLARFKPNVSINGTVSFSNPGPQAAPIRPGEYEDASYPLQP